ncbi:MAG: hypothetical protein ACFCU1_11165 [Sumerlaeia bacterium]
MKHPFRHILTAMLFTLPLAASAQQQPPQAVNQQDEIINIPIAPGQSIDDAIAILRSDDKFETNEYVTQAVEVFNT